MESRLAPQPPPPPQYPCPLSHPNYFPQAVTNPQPAYCYPDIALAEYRQWMHDVYLKDKLKPYLQAAERKGKLPPAFTNTVSYSTFIWTRFDNLERSEGRHSLPRPLSKAFPGLLMPQSSLLVAQVASNAGPGAVLRLSPLSFRFAAGTQAGERLSRYRNENSASLR